MSSYLLLFLMICFATFGYFVIKQIDKGLVRFESLKDERHDSYLSWESSSNQSIYVLGDTELVDKLYRSLMILEYPCYVFNSLDEIIELDKLDRSTSIVLLYKDDVANMMNAAYIKLCNATINICTYINEPSNEKYLERLNIHYLAHVDENYESLLKGFKELLDDYQMV